jgi:hypothetical protein
MAVLVEATSVIIRADVIKERYPGGWTAFRDAVPNHTLACDGKEARATDLDPTPGTQDLN